MISYISASGVYPVNAPVIENGVLGVDPEGKITAVMTAEEAQAKGIADITVYEGILVPGFVNTHCHLELSHMKGELKGKKGLVDFVQQVMKTRAADDYSIELAMLKADLEMCENGIVAVGDISNQVISRSIKSGSPLYYHTFLEVMGFNPATVDLSMERARSFEAEFGDVPISLVPHAPYSVSRVLFEAIAEHATSKSSILSIHNQETAQEDDFFKNKTGDFLKLYEFLGLDIDFYKSTGKSSLQSYLPLLPPDLKTLLVHNTFTKRADVDFATSIHPNLYWCLCPGANQYIEGCLPDVPMFMEAGLRITLGTDSLASNDGLSILREMNRLQSHFEIPIADLIRWGTWNGAEFLGITDRYGSFEPGKQPGVNLLNTVEMAGKTVLGTWVKRLF
ncbi:amidohydrolase family protein [Pedobacter sp. GR22-6]|uniref:amidohydrolase family protein n=1 Tax=Pedobacter sp. GR22-6 TaxID=3127957 RepID=UPI00307CEA1B